MPCARSLRRPWPCRGESENQDWACPQRVQGRRIPHVGRGSRGAPSLRLVRPKAVGSEFVERSETLDSVKSFGFPVDGVFEHRQAVARGLQENLLCRRVEVGGSAAAQLWGNFAGARHQGVRRLSVGKLGALGLDAKIRQLLQAGVLGAGGNDDRKLAQVPDFPLLRVLDEAHFEEAHDVAVEQGQERFGTDCTANRCKAHTVGVEDAGLLIARFDGDMVRDGGPSHPRA